MKKITFLKTMLVVVTFGVASENLMGQTLIAGWDFQTTGNGGTAITATSCPSVFVSNFGAGTMHLDGTNGSSTWNSNEIVGTGGTAVNAGVGFSTTITTPACLSLTGGTAGSPTNGKFMVIKLSMAGLSNLVVSYASQGTTTGFTSQVWEYSTNGSTWVPVQTITPIPTLFAAIKLNTITGLDNATSAYLRFSGTGATSGSGNNKIDNIQLVASQMQHVATPTFSIPQGNVNGEQHVNLTTTTDGASIYYTLDGSNPDNNGNGTLYDGNPIVINSTKTIKAIAYHTGLLESVIATATYTFPSPVADIATLRTLPTTGFYTLTGEAFLTFKSATVKANYIQDATGGILLIDPNSKITTTYSINDGITGITGILASSSGMLQFVSMTDPGAATSKGNTVTPIVVNLSNIADYQGQLVTVKNVSILGTGNFEALTSYIINDGNSGNLRTEYPELNFIGYAIPTLNQDITGVVSNHSVLEADLVPRSLDDIVPSILTSVSCSSIDQNITAINGNVLIKASADEIIQIYNTFGQKLIQTLSVEGVNTIPVRVKGVVLVRVGDRFAKVVL
ncbi:MAG: chitobiase/beta-hexosaminidase C-terminal domain-containing protein [Paludibacter sp.]|nr:chitobiase/beta-hexosaminidase C-terminal domain-containing protein [Paludibacter sp.]